MDVLVEVHDQAELQRALALGAEIIGINNRDLTTLRIDVSTTERLAALVPEDRVLVSESGIASRDDVERLGRCADAFLVGSSLMAAEDIAQAARRLVFGSVKICGLTRGEDVDLAAAAGATHAGLIFAESSRRTGPDAAQLAQRARASGLRAVGVFQNQPLDEVARTADALGLDAVQLHGREEGLDRLRADLPGSCEIWAVSAVGDQAEPARAGADRTLFDTRVADSCGGTGRAFDWSLVAGRPDLAKGFLAGGIGPANARAAQRIGAFGLDVGSSIEASPGRKDPERLRALFAALRPDCRQGPQCG